MLRVVTQQLREGTLLTPFFYMHLEITATNIDDMVRNGPTVDSLEGIYIDIYHVHPKALYYFITIFLPGTIHWPQIFPSSSTPESSLSCSLLLGLQKPTWEQQRNQVVTGIRPLACTARISLQKHFCHQNSKQNTLQFNISIKSSQGLHSNLIVTY